MSGRGVMVQGCFNPRPSCEGRSRLLRHAQRSKLFQSAPLLRGAMSADLLACRWRVVSIRAPLARGDAAEKLRCNSVTCFNPRPSCEGRCYHRDESSQSLGFQSAPLLRGAILSM